MIKIQITEEDIKKCRAFALAKIKNAYNRLNETDEEREEKHFFGKLGEVVFLKLLNSKGIFPNVEEMFKIWEETTKGDKFDFETKDGELIDVKTAYRNNHKNILVPYDQFEKGKNKDFYVGVKINEEITEGEVVGFCSKDKLIENGKTDRFGKMTAYWELLKDLEDIENLIKKF